MLELNIPNNPDGFLNWVAIKFLNIVDVRLIMSDLNKNVLNSENKKNQNFLFRSCHRGAKWCTMFVFMKLLDFEN